jgi:hypothetical protein
MNGHSMVPNLSSFSSTLSTLPPIEGGPAHQAPGGPQAPGAPQAHETEQIHGGSVIQLSQGQGALTLAPRAPTPTLLYETPNDVPKPLTISEMETAARIAAHLRYFRNLLGLHCIATCAEDALWFHLAWLAKRRLRRDVSFKDWGYFLRVCNESGKMLRYVFATSKFCVRELTCIPLVGIQKRSLFAP